MLNLKWLVALVDRKVTKVALLAATLAGIATTVVITTKPAAIQPRNMSTAAPQYHADFQTDPAVVRANEPAELRFDVKNERGENIRFLEFVHERPIHLMIVSDDLSEFYHVHPELVIDYFSLSQTFPAEGKYHLFTDYTPPGGTRKLEQFEVSVAGKARPHVTIKPDTDLTKTVGGIRMTMHPDEVFKAGKDYLVRFSIADEQTRLPVTDLQLYLGALAHAAVFSQDLKSFIHAHALEECEVFDPSSTPFHAHNPTELTKKLVGPSPSELKVAMIFPHPGLYKMWVQIQRNERVINVPYVVSVTAGEDVAPSKNEIPEDAVRISISKTGYEPARVDLKKGVPVKLAFTRTDAENCGGTIVFPSLNIRRELAAGQTEIIELTPTESGDIAFSCRMGMYRGALVVSE